MYAYEPTNLLSETFFLVAPNKLITFIEKRSLFAFVNRIDSGLKSRTTYFLR